MELVDEGGVRLAFERAGGAGDPVVLIHGGWDDHRAWDRVLPGLAVAFQVLVYDRRGHGESCGPPPARPVRDDAVDLARLLESSELYPAHLVAHAYGGAVALRLAVERPELVRSVAVHEVPFVALAGAHPPDAAPGPSVADRLEGVREIALAGPGEAAAREYLELFGAEAERWPALDERERGRLVPNAALWAREMGDPDAVRPTAGELRQVGVPVLATSGGESPPFAGQIQERLAAELPNATALRLREGGHLVHRTSPDLLVGVLGSFLLERNVPTS